MLKRTLLALAATAVLALTLPAFAQTQGNPMPAPTKSGYAPITGLPENLAHGMSRSTRGPATAPFVSVSVIC